MNLAFAAHLVNGPFGDPGLYIDLCWQGRALLFDLGHNEALPLTEMLRLSHVFVSHCHMDHFIGFDRLLRLFLGRDKKLHFFGPPGILACVEGKLRGYTWNLVDNYGFAIEVSEVAPDGIRRLVFALEEKSHLNVDTGWLNHLGVRAGPWLAELKHAMRRGEPDEWLVTARWRHKDGEEERRDFTLGDLRGHLVKETHGQKIAYVVDTLYSQENAARIAALASGADLFFCESPFLAEDEDQATRRYHLTARQAGLLGRAAGARKLVVFHFSPRYSGRAECLYQEAREAFGEGGKRVEDEA